MKTYIEKLSVRKIMKGWYQVQGHHRNHTITIAQYEDGLWNTEGKYYSSFKDAKANVFQELATENAEICNWLRGEA
jgi:hypothetical protein